MLYEAFQWNQYFPVKPIFVLYRVVVIYGFGVNINQSHQKKILKKYLAALGAEFCVQSFLLFNAESGTLIAEKNTVVFSARDIFWKFFLHL